MQGCVYKKSLNSHLPKRQA